MPRGNNKILWTDEMISFLKDNYTIMTNRELASALNLRLTSTRTKLYELGFKRMEMEYWTDEQTQFLIDHYKIWGDVEMADYFKNNYPKQKGWTKKHIEKKRRYLKLKHTAAEIEQIKLRNINVLGSGKKSNKKRWAGRISPVGTIKKWKYPGNYPAYFIKTEKGYVWLPTYNWRKHFGEIPPGYIVARKNPEIEDYSPENLMLLSYVDNIKRNFHHDDNWYASVIARGNQEIKQALLNDKNLLNLFRTNSKFRREIENAVTRKAV